MPVQYGQYSLANSRLVPKAPGLPLAETQRLLEVKQGLYNMADAAREGTIDARDSAVHLPGSTKALEELNGNLNQTLKTLGARPDLENVSREMGNMYKDYKRNVAPFIQEYQAYQKWNEDLTKSDKLNPEAKQNYRTYALATHTGVRRDPTTGAYVANFRPPDVVNDVDLPAKIDKWLSSVVAQKTNRETKVLSKDGMKYIQSGNETILVTPQMLQEAMSAALHLDNEVKSYVGREVGFAGMKGSTKDEQQSLAESKNKELTDNMWQYAKKYLRHDTDIKYLEGDSAAGTAAANQTYSPNGMFIADMPAIPQVLDTRTPEELNKKMTEFTTTGAVLRDDLKRLSGLINDPNITKEQRVAYQLDYQNKQQQLNGVTTQQQNLRSVAMATRNGILGSADVQVYKPIMDKINTRLNAIGIGNATDKTTGEVYTPYEIFAGNPKYKNGVVTFSTVDGRPQSVQMSETKFNKAMSVGNYKTKSNGSWLGDLSVDGSANDSPNSLHQAIARQRDKVFGDAKNFQIAGKQLVLTPELRQSFSGLIAANPSMEARDMKNNKVEKVEDLLKHEMEVTGVSFDDVTGTGDQSFTVRVNKGKSGAPDYQYYTMQFPNSKAKDILLNQAYFGKKVPIQLTQWAQNIANTQELGVSAPQISNMKIGQKVYVPGTKNLVIKAVAESDLRDPSHPRSGSRLYLAAGTEDDNGNFNLLELGKEQGKPIYAAYDATDPASMIKILAGVKATANLKQ